MQVRNFENGGLIAQALIVRDVELRTRRAGREYLQLMLGDRSGSVPAVVWDGVVKARDLCHTGAVVHVSGRFFHHKRFGAHLGVEKIRAATEREHEELQAHDGPARSAVQMEADLRELVATVQDPHLQRLLAQFIGEKSPVWALYREAPAAKRYHQAYRHGLLEHCLTVAQAVSSISATFPGIDRDVAVTGALLHDIGKLEAYEVHGDGIELSDNGRLHGEIPLGYYRVRTAIEGIDAFPAETAQAVLHIILSHHGSLEHGSPVVPCTREATLVHMIDNLGGRLGSFDRLERELTAGQHWTSYDRGIGGGAYFAPPGEPQRRAA